MSRATASDHTFEIDESRWLVEAVMNQQSETARDWMIGDEIMSNEIIDLLNIGSASVDITREVEPLAAAIWQDTSPNTIEQEYLDIKGKSPSDPVPIQSKFEKLPHDVSEFSGSWHSGSDDCPTASTSTSYGTPLQVSSPFDFAFETETDDVDMADSGMSDSQLTVLGKGKGRAPILPPLELVPSDFGITGADWPSTLEIGSATSSSSFATENSSAPARVLAPPEPVTPISLDFSDIQRLDLARVPSRRRSLSNLSMYPTSSFKSLSSKPRIKVKLGSSKSPSNLARSLLLRSRTATQISSSSVLDNDSSIVPLASQSDFECQTQIAFDAVLCDLKSPVPPLVFIGSDYDAPFTVALAGHKYSSSLPTYTKGLFPRVPIADSVSVETQSVSYFGKILPREIKIKILSLIPMLHQESHDQLVAEGEWTSIKACSSRHRWVGSHQGVRELVKLSRVSKDFMSMVFDGQIWASLDLRSFPRIPAHLLSRLARFAGPFVKSLDLAGHTQLRSSTLTNMTTHLTLDEPASPGTQLMFLNLQGCTKLSTLALQNLLICSPNLRSIGVRGLPAVTNSIMDVIAIHCPLLESLDLSQCSEVDGDGIYRFSHLVMQHEKFAPLKELRISGLKFVSDIVLAMLGRAAPFLEVLDLSYMRHLHNSAILALVACAEDEPSANTILLTASQAGMRSGTGSYRRRITRLRHVSISYCRLLTDIACSSLAYTVPDLEFFEFAGIGVDLKDEGLIRLLNTTPNIRRLDLEDASEITDAVLNVITPSLSNSDVSNSYSSQPGHALEYLNISFAPDISDDAVLTLIRNCVQLKVLYADNTNIADIVMEEFVTLSRKRRLLDATIVANDCRGISESLIKELSPQTRPRLGWRSYEAKNLAYLDGRDNESLTVGQDECDPFRVVVKTFFSWQTVDAVQSAREKKRKAHKRNKGSYTDSDGPAGRLRWWMPRSGSATPLDIPTDREGCVVM